MEKPLEFFLKDDFSVPVLFQKPPAHCFKGTQTLFQPNPNGLLMKATILYGCYTKK
jgi:hypothetical protein